MTNFQPFDCAVLAHESLADFDESANGQDRQNFQAPPAKAPSAGRRNFKRIWLRLSEAADDYGESPTEQRRQKF